MTSVNEDLMKEHGLLNRLLLIYEEIIRRLQNNLIISNKIINDVAKIIRVFIEDHHEKTEELYIFPLLLKNNVNVQLVNELIGQHKFGRLLTDNIMNLSQNETNPIELIKNIQAFIKMYRYHASREDTIIFQDFKKLLSEKEYDEISEFLEKEEEKVLGENGYGDTLGIIISIEKYLGINAFNQ